MAFRRGTEIRLLEATCPHRGAHLGFGGRVAGNCAICPFHGLAIHLGEDSEASPMYVSDYPCLVKGGMVFLRLSDHPEPDLESAIDELEGEFTLIPGFTMVIDAPLEVAADNAMDAAHFKTVHGILNDAEFTVSSGKFGELRADGEFVIPSMDPAHPQKTIYTTGAFSPGLVISRITGTPPLDYGVISTGVPGPEPNKSTLRVTLAMRKPVDEWFSKILLQSSRDGLEKDHAVWKHMDAAHVPEWTPADTSALAFMKFCKRFGA